MEISYKTIIKNTRVCRKDEYIDFFFKTIVGTDETPIYGKEDGAVFSDYFDVSIIKNYREKRTKTGNTYIGKYWRTCVFCFINRKDACEYLSPIGKDEYSFEKDIISWKSTNGFSNNSIDNNCAFNLNNNIFRYFKKKRSSWFVRSFVYFVLIVCDETTPISSKDYYVQYWNSKYQFKKANKTSLFGKSKEIIFISDVATELKLINNENKESIDCVKAYLGMLDFFPENEEAFVDIKKDVDEGIPYIICQGAARTGKTVLALRLLNEYPEFKLLLMNYAFYVSLKDAFGVINFPFPYDRIFHHDLSHKKTGCWIEGSERKTIKIDISRLIVDEAQRLGSVEETYTYNGVRLSSFDSIDTIVNSRGHIQTIFFGDDSQRLHPKYDKGIKTIKEAIGYRDYREYYFSSPLGVPPEILKDIQFLLNHDKTKPYSLNNFSISVEKDPSVFSLEYFMDDQKKKHLVVPLTGDVNIDKIEIGDLTFKSPKSVDSKSYFFNHDVQNDYFLTAYSVISRELESVYLFLPKHIYLSDKNTIESKYSNDNTFLLNHLYTIMTRATMSLVICCEDEKLGEYFNERIEAIKHSTESVEENDSTINYDYDIFIAYFGTGKPEGTLDKAKEICDLLRHKGLSVFLYNYSSLEKDKYLRFTETWHALHRSETMMFVFNENVDKDRSGLVKRECQDGSISRIYQELSEFQNMVDEGSRRAKHDARFFYSGSVLTKFNVYPFLNKYYPPLTQGNSDCCFMNKEEMLAWVDKRFVNKDEE